MLHVFLDFSDVDLEVLVPLEFRLNRNNILRVPDLPVMDSLKVLLELIKLSPQLFSLSLDAC